MSTKNIDWAYAETPDVSKAKFLLENIYKKKGITSDRAILSFMKNSTAR
jgi:hypothetical protein